MDKQPVRVTVDKSIEIDLGVYTVTCSECGNELFFDANADSEGDWDVEVMPCEDCIKEKANELFEEYKFNGGD